MKNVFGYTDSTIEGMEFDGKDFITASIPISLRDELYAAIDNESDIEFKRGSKLWISILSWLFALGFFAAASLAITTLIESGVAGLIANAPLAFYGAIVCAVLFAVLTGVNKLLDKRAATDGKLDSAKAKLKEVKNRCEAALGVPYDRKKVDVFNYWYEKKQGKDEEMLDLECDEKSLFREGDMLCIASDEQVFELPIEGFTRYVLKKDKADMFEWHKDIPCYEGEYSQYNIEHDGDDFFSCRYYALQYAEGFGEYEIFFAEYELPLFKAIVDVPVVEE